MKTIHKSQNNGLKTTKIANNSTKKEQINPIIFIAIIAFLHILGVALVVTGVVIGFSHNIKFNVGVQDIPDVPLFSKPIDLAVYFPIIIGTTILCGMLVYWVVFWKIKKVVANEKRDNKFVKEQWIHYNHIMNFDKVKASPPAKPK